MWTLLLGGWVQHSLRSETNAIIIGGPQARLRTVAPSCLPGRCILLRNCVWSEPNLGPIALSGPNSVPQVQSMCSPEMLRTSVLLGSRAIEPSSESRARIATAVRPRLCKARCFNNALNFLCPPDSFVFWSICAHQKVRVLAECHGLHTQIPIRNESPQPSTHTLPTNTTEPPPVPGPERTHSGYHRQRRRPGCTVCCTPDTTCGRWRSPPCRC